MPRYRTAWIATDVGSLRRGNEDRCLAGCWVADGRDGSWSVRLGPDETFAVVADGMGGHQAGKLASGIAIAELSTSLRHARSETTIARLLDLANQRVFEAMYSPRGRPGMGSTVAGVVVGGGQALFFNVGDSRAYLVRAGAIVQQTVDHTPGAGDGAPQWRSHALTQSLGGGVSRTPLRPHIRRVAILPGDAVLLCSDGLTDMVHDDDIRDALAAGPAHPAEVLVKRALEAGGRDNVTVVIVGPAEG